MGTEEKKRSSKKSASVTRGGSQADGFRGLKMRTVEKKGGSKKSGVTRGGSEADGSRSVKSPPKRGTVSAAVVERAVRKVSRESGLQKHPGGTR